MRAQFSVTVVDGKPGEVVVNNDSLPDGTFVVGWGISEQEENLIVMFSPGDGESTLYAQVRTLFPRLPRQART